MPGDFVTVNQIVHIHQLAIERPGRYKFVFQIDGMLPVEVPFAAELAS